MHKLFNLQSLQNLLPYCVIEAHGADAPVRCKLWTNEMTYPPQSHKFRTKFPRKRTCEYSTSTTHMYNKHIDQKE